MTLQELKAHIEAQAHVIKEAYVKNLRSASGYEEWAAYYIITDEKGNNILVSFRIGVKDNEAYYLTGKKIEDYAPTYKASIIAKLDAAVAQSGNNYIGYTNLVFNTGSDGATVDVFVFDSGTDKVSRTAFYFDGAGTYKEMST